MPFRFALHHDLKVAYKRVWGVYDDTEMNASIAVWDLLIDSHTGVQDYVEVHDLTRVTEYLISPEGISARASKTLLRRESSGVRPSKLTAYVMPSAEGFGTGRIYSAIVADSGETFRVFRDIPEAIEWLALSPADWDDIQALYESEAQQY